MDLETMPVDVMLPCCHGNSELCASSRENFL